MSQKIRYRIGIYPSDNMTDFMNIFLILII